MTGGARCFFEMLASTRVSLLPRLQFPMPYWHMICEDDFGVHRHLNNNVRYLVFMFYLLHMLDKSILDNHVSVFCYRPQTKSQEGNVFTAVSLFPGETCLSTMPWGRQTPSITKHHLYRQTPTPPRWILWDTVNKQAVRILLECILVSKVLLIVLWPLG